MRPLEHDVRSSRSPLLDTFQILGPFNSFGCPWLLWSPSPPSAQIDSCMWGNPYPGVSQHREGLSGMSLSRIPSPLPTLSRSDHLKQLPSGLSPLLPQCSESWGHQCLLLRLAHAMTLLCDSTANLSDPETMRSKPRSSGTGQI